jgi:hypothetical protein
VLLILREIWTVSCKLGTKINDREMSEKVKMNKIERLVNVCRKKGWNEKVVLVCDVIWDIMGVVYIGVVILLSECV